VDDGLGMVGCDDQRLRHAFVLQREGEDVRLDPVAGRMGDKQRHRVPRSGPFQAQQFRRVHGAKVCSAPWNAPLVLASALLMLSIRRRRPALELMDERVGVPGGPLARR
jgi:hypothetical protein